MSEYRPSAYWEELLGRQYDLSGVAYPDYPVAFNSALYDAMRRSVLRMLESGGLGVAGRDILEIGPGTGYWVNLWLRHDAHSVTGVDITETAAAKLRELFPDQQFLVGDIGADDTRMGTFDMVCAMSVLLHIVDDARFRTALANIAGMLRPDGFLLLVEPMVMRSWWGPPVGPSSNSRARTVAQWHSALAEAGLELRLTAPATAILANVCDTKHARSWRLHMAYWWLLRRWLTAVPRLTTVTLWLLVALDRILLRCGIAPSAKVMLIKPTRAAAGGSAQDSRIV